METKCQQHSQCVSKVKYYSCRKETIMNYSKDQVIITVQAALYSSTHHWGLWRHLLLLNSWDGLCFWSWLALQDVCLNHFQVPVLCGDVAIFEWNEDGASVLAGKPLLSLQGGVGAGCVWVQVILEQIRLGRCEGRRKYHEQKKESGKCWLTSQRLEAESLKTQISVWLLDIQQKAAHIPYAGLSW